MSKSSMPTGKSGYATARNMEPGKAFHMGRPVGSVNTTTHDYQVPVGLIRSTLCLIIALCWFIYEGHLASTR